MQIVRGALQRGERRSVSHPAVRTMRHLHFAFFILHVVFIGCARPRPVTPQPGPPQAVDPVQQLRTDIDAALNQPGHLHGTWGVVIESLARNDRLYERNPQTLLVPGSTMKLVTVAVASETATWEYTFETRLLTAGSIDDGVLKGDLVLVGGGDPSLLGRPVSDTIAPWVDALKARGITRVTGRVIGDDDAVEEPRPGFAWSWEDMGFAYGALPGALNFAENVVDVTVTPGNAEGLPATIEVPPHARGLEVVNRITTIAAGTPTNLWPEIRPGDVALTIYGTIGQGAAPAVVSAAAGNPTLWVARALRNALLEAGIDVEGEAADIDDLPVKPARDGLVLHEHRSPPLSEVAKPLLKESINLYAEAVLRLATGPEGPRTTDPALDAVRLRLQAWGIPPDGIQIVDGSGLSRRDVIAPETLVTVLRRFYDPSKQSPWMQALAVAGRDGTLERRMKGTPGEGNALAKSGSMSNIRTLAGYVWSADGEPLVYAVMANNFEGSAANVVATIDKVIVRLASFSRTPR